MSNERKVTRRGFLLGSSAVIAGSLLAACPAPTQPAAPAVDDPAAPPDPEEITLLFHTRLGAHGDWHRARLPVFEEQYPGVRLELDEIPGIEMITKIYAMSAAGNVGDVVWTYLGTMREHVFRQVPLALGDIIQARGYDTTVFWDSVMEALTVEGNLYGIPNHGHYGTTTFYYNEQLYDEAGAPQPHPNWTVDELIAGARLITDPPTIWGYRALGAGQEHMPQYLRTFGGDVMNAEGTQSLLLEEGSVEGLRWLYDLIFTHEVDPCLCNPGSEIRDTFVAGTLGCYNWTPGFASEFLAIEDWAFEWDATVAPIGPNGHRGSQVSGAAFCVTTNSDHPDEAFNVLDFFSTWEDGVEHVLFGAGSPGTRDDVWRSEELLAYHPIYSLTQEAYPDGPAGWHNPANGRNEEFIDTMNNNLEMVWTGLVGFEEGIEMTHELLQEVLDRPQI
jgi:multiple sugar transport system substrate-binding protein